jgi:hypothetical protein
LTGVAVKITVVPAVTAPEGFAKILTPAGSEGFTVTLNGAENAEQPFAFVTVTVYEPDEVTVIA